MIALRGELYTPTEQISRGVLLIDGAVITAVGSAEEVAIPSGAQVLDAELIAPGYIELQLNGAFGSDFATEPAAISAVAARLPQTGVTSFLPTLISAPRERYQPWIQAVRALPASEPEEGSVNPHAPMNSPEASFGMYFFFCASLPATKI